MDIHRTLAEVVVWQEGRLRWHGRVGINRSGLEGFGRSLATGDEVVLEATGNAMAVARVLSPHMARVIMANRLQVKAIAHPPRAPGRGRRDRTEGSSNGLPRQLGPRRR